MRSKLSKLIDHCVEACGTPAVEARLQTLLDEHQVSTLTIIANKGMHPLRSVHTRGEVYFASEGTLDFSSEAMVLTQMEDILRRLRSKLHSRPWKRIYLVPFGPAALAMQIKLFVYRVLHMETIDVLHAGNDEYYDIEIHQRDLLPTTVPTNAPEEVLTS